MGRKGGAAAGKRATSKGKGGGGDADSDTTDNEDADRASTSFSLASAAAADTSAFDTATDGRLKLSEAVENLGEKRASVREGALKSLAKVLRSGSKALVDTVLDYSDALLSSLLKLLRRPASESEGVGCMQVAALYCCVLGSDENAAFEALEKVLVPLVHDDVAEALRVKAVATLAFACFVCSSDATDRVMTLIEDVLCEESEGAPATDALRARAALAWQLLASAAPTEAVLERSKVRVFEAVADLLEADDSDVRIAAGQVLAALWEVAVADDGGGDAAAADCRVSGLARCENPAVVSQAVAALQRVAKDSSKRVSKRDRKEQRAALRDAEAWVVNGESPSGETVRLQGAVLQMDTFARLRLLEELREVLGDALPSCLRVFPVLQDVLGVVHLADAMDGDGCDSAVKKGSATEKLRSGYRKQERNYRDISMAFGDGYDDDFDGGGGGDGWGDVSYEKKGGGRR